MLKTRVEALERHAEHRKSNPTPTTTVENERSPKKARTETPVKKVGKSTVPPSGIRKIFSWAIPSSAPRSQTSVTNEDAVHVIISEESQVTPSKANLKEKGKAPALEAGEDPVSLDMSQIGSSGITTTATSLPHPSSPIWRSANTTIPVTRPPASLLSSTRPTPRTLSAILASSSSSSTSLDHSTTTRLYPSLTPSLSQRSTALNALFTPGTKSAELPKAGAMPLKRNTSVKDLVQSFEVSGILDHSLNKERR